MKVLVVDDNADIATMVATVLTKDGHDVSKACSGSEALSAALLSEYDLLLCDLMLPDLEGTEIIRAIKAQSPRLPVVAMSALDSDRWREACAEAGASCLLQKPIDLKRLRFEVSLVQKARLSLAIALVDPDAIHRIRMQKTLSALGCAVGAFSSTTPAQQHIELGHAIGLIVIDAEAEGAAAFVRWGKQQDILSFVFSGQANANSEDQMLRSGAAFLLRKPVDMDTLLTQAGFLLAG